MELIINIINGRFNNYAEVKALSGYCFYDADEENRQYMNKVITPLTDTEAIKRKYVVIQGNADKLNEELQNALDSE